MHHIQLISLELVVELELHILPHGKMEADKTDELMTSQQWVPSRTGKINGSPEEELQQCSLSTSTNCQTALCWRAAFHPHRVFTLNHSDERQVWTQVCWFLWVIIKFLSSTALFLTSFCWEVCFSIFIVAPKHRGRSRGGARGALAPAEICLAPEVPLSC